jgi:hypothetical protein
MPGDPHIYGGPGQTRRDVPLTRRGRLVYYSILAILIGAIAALLIVALVTN